MYLTGDVRKAHQYSAPPGLAMMKDHLRVLVIVRVKLPEDPREIAYFGPGEVCEKHGSDDDGASEVETGAPAVVVSTPEAFAGESIEADAVAEDISLEDSTPSSDTSGSGVEADGGEVCSATASRSTSTAVPRTERRGGLPKFFFRRSGLFGSRGRFLSLLSGRPPSIRSNKNCWSATKIADHRARLKIVGAGFGDKKTRGGSARLQRHNEVIVADPGLAKVEFVIVYRTKRKHEKVASYRTHPMLHRHPFPVVQKPPPPGEDAVDAGTTTASCPSGARVPRPHPGTGLRAGPLPQLRIPPGFLAPHAYTIVFGSYPCSCTPMVLLSSWARQEDRGGTASDARDALEKRHGWPRCTSCPHETDREHVTLTAAWGWGASVVSSWHALMQFRTLRL